MHAKRRETRQNMWFEFSYNDDKVYRHKIVTIRIGNSIIVLEKLISYGRSRFGSYEDIHAPITTTANHINEYDK